MNVIRSLEGLSAVPGPVCVAIGVFDGVHLGHQALIRRAMDEAHRADGAAVVLTFHPHPLQVLRPESRPRLLTSTPHKEKLIAECGCANLLVVPFDAEFAAQAPEVFIENLAARSQGLHCICVGHQWAFGRGRTGNVDLLRTLGSRLGFETVEIDPVMAGGATISSTRIRRSIEEGDFATARELLGRDYTILGTVQRGANLGARLGFPTANLAAHNEQFPPNGVYTVQALLRGTWRPGVANVGVRPTVDGISGRVLEVHLFDFEGECYGEDMEVQFGRFLRSEQKFESLEALKGQIRRDVVQGRADAEKK